MHCLLSSCRQAYPLASPATARALLPSPDLSFLTTGGYVYMDEDRRVCEAASLVPAGEGGGSSEDEDEGEGEDEGRGGGGAAVRRTLHFQPAQPLQSECAAALARSGRWRRVAPQGLFDGGCIVCEVAGAHEQS